MRTLTHRTIDARYHTAYIPLGIEPCTFGDEIELESRCVMCQVESRLTVSLESYGVWHNGAAVQRAFPTVSPADREQFFMTGICGQCWDQMFLGQEDD